MSIDWNAVAWSLIAGVCLAFAAIHFVIGCMQIGQRGALAAARKNIAGVPASPFLPAGEVANLSLSALALSIAAIIIGDVMLMHAQTPAAFGEIMRWLHVPIFTLIVALLLFVRAYFHCGRLWLAGVTVGLRVVGLVINFAADVNVNYLKISALKQVEIIGAQTATVAVGVRNPWSAVMELSALLTVVFIADALVTTWRNGGKVERRRATRVGSALLVMALLMVGRGVLINTGVIEGVYLFGLPFLIVCIAIAFEFGADIIRSVRLASRLQISESALRLSERRMAQASHAARLGMWEWDVARGEIWGSAAFRELYGFDAAERVDFDRVLQAVHPDERDDWQQKIRQSLHGGGVHEFIHRIVLPGGGVRWVDVRGSVDRDGAGAIVMRGVSIDISERKKAEFELEQQRNELAHLSRVTMLGELSGSLAHELNQPLTAILSNAQAALRFMANDRGNIDEVREILKDIVSDDRRAGEIIQGLRVLLKKGERKNELLDINAAVQGVLRLTRSDLLNASIVVSTQLAADLPEAVGDPVQLQQVLLNLVINGCDAMSGNAVDDRQLAVSTRLDAEGRIVVCVEDRGGSVPPEHLESVFSPFFTTKKEGLGLGLAVCRQIIAAHGGRLWAENNPLKGASFFFTVQARLPGGA